MSHVIVDKLDIDVFKTAENVEAWPLCRTGYFVSHPAVAYFPCCIFVNFFNHPVSLLPSLCSCLSFFSYNSLVLISDTLTLIWLRRSCAPYLGCHSPNLLLVNSLDNYPVG